MSLNTSGLAPSNIHTAGGLSFFNTHSTGTDYGSATLGPDITGPHESKMLSKLDDTRVDGTQTGPSTRL
jgi:hypothetical protein